MTARGFFRILCNIIAYPFKKLWNCFRRTPQPETVVSHRIPDPQLSPTKPRRAKVARLKEKELQGIIHFRPLFLPDHFSSMSDSKNDAEFKDSREKIRRKLEREKVRKEFMDRLEKQKEKDKPDPPTPPKKTLH